MQVKKYVRDSTGNEGEFTGNFIWDGNGNPLRVSFDRGGELEETYTFGYDAQGRLNKYTSFLNLVVIRYASTHRYGYSANGKIIRDTLEYATLTEFSQITHSMSEYRLEYDSKGRIVKESGTMFEKNFVPVNEDLGTRVYSYDKKGNLVLPRESKYDHKKNFLRTHEIWMLITRNHSVNNPVGATGYNQYDLPLGFSKSVPGLELFSTPLNIVYECAEPK
jgi:hypothetical protein